MSLIGSVFLFLQYLVLTSGKVKRENGLEVKAGKVESGLYVKCW